MNEIDIIILKLLEIQESINKNIDSFEDKKKREV
ncbi:hypothetical protein CLROS_020220 [Clostridium felsineum]|uniref:Uncharacterized protein n=1 Tax=Clostridium felsineum TaxID=36839 RepID=A0A1S8L4L7_9CLOT|nr:hypothetical protein CLAUR_006590 [Clostridium felsineum]URZ06689.1 hypothetical protein CLROS_020220 [Clostridium felsineum]URZ11722.1 hypothetical protein CROST_024390 [Clostridium felsineum]URZ16282.1 hypothetical protein CLFE_023290 [Clostridium felsineum DSM 794]